jgi:ABC-type Fe3+/spermidine/putrescine transport system ATPase subunit
MVFQSYALFPHLSVFENVAFGLRLKRRSREEIERTVNDVLGLVDLAQYGERMPSELSGGQQQRVALARALAVQPTVLLLDEPLSNLDLKLREQMRDEIRRLQRRVGITALYVTHDQGEAMAMSDRIAVMNHGLVEQVGTPREVYERPASLFVARFIGQCTVLEGSLEAIVGTAARFVSRAGTGFTVDCEGVAGTAGRAVGLVIRPEFVEVRPSVAMTNGHPAVNAMDAVVEEAVYVGERIDLTLRLAQGDSIIVAQRVLPGRALPQPGDQVVIAVPPTDLSLVPLPGGAGP